MLKKFLITLAVIIFLAAVAVGVLWYTFHSGQLQEQVIEQVGKRLDAKPEDINFFEKVLGLSSPQTYLVLFLNNTELRPAGGFIGSYAVVRFDKGIPTLLKVDGTEILDNTAPDFESVPPEPMAKYLKIQKWSFRDSNWSPDFSIAATKALELYKKENGTEANNINGIVAFTPTCLEEILKITGPITVNGMTFDSQNFTEKLEYEVEYGYANRGISFDERKQMLKDLTGVMLAKMREDIIDNWSKYLTLVEKMANEKQLMAYSLEPEIQTFLSNKNWAGRMTRLARGDYLMWVDANLGALKTDAAIKRELTVRVDSKEEKNMVNTVKMKYIHGGKFDWRTSRYQTYARIFVTEGSRLVGISGIDVPEPEKGKPKINPLTLVDQGVENGFQWFGVFFTVEPGQTKELTFTYVPPIKVSQQLNGLIYRMRVQKQPGLVNATISANMGFSKKIMWATPGSHNNNYGEDRYIMSFDFNNDTDFEVEVSPIFK
ncbi:DUF4012 domain-containing protein [Patescibacteria group bacterium]|nr:DUF4012 domain-containing protein [Patescibacteria group bacterium]